MWCWALAGAGCAVTLQGWLLWAPGFGLRAGRSRKIMQGMRLGSVWILLREGVSPKLCV